MTYWCCKADFGKHEPTCDNCELIHEDELPEGYPYDEMFKYSFIPGGVGCRVFPKVYE
jgi:hypothetical protein